MVKSSSKLFNSFLAKAIDQGLLILGDDNVKQAFFYQVEKRGLPRSEIPLKLEAFHKVLTDLFGEGAFTLEKRMARRLHDNLDIEFEAHDGWTLKEYSESAKKASKADLTTIFDSAHRKQSLG